MTGYGEGLLNLFYIILHKGGSGTKNLQANEKLQNELLALQDAGFIQSVRIGDSYSWVLTDTGIYTAEYGREIMADRVDKSMSDTLEMIACRRQL